MTKPSFEKPRWEVLGTDDGSPTVRDLASGATFHSTRGAWMETEWVYGLAGLDFTWRESGQPLEMSVLEMGFGSGLNALWAAQWAAAKGVQLYYVAVEAYPLDPSSRELLGSAVKKWKPEFFELWHALNLADWDKPVAVTPYFSLLKLHCSWESLTEAQLKVCKDLNLSSGDQSVTPFNLCFFDAFGPGDQPELWDLRSLQKAAGLIAPGGFLVTYSVQGEFRRILESLGFEVEKIPGPPGKREITRAVKVEE